MMAAAGVVRASRLVTLLLLQLLVCTGWVGLEGADAATDLAAAAGGKSKTRYSVTLKPGPRRRARSGPPESQVLETVRMMDQHGRAYTCELPSLSQPSTRTASPPSSIESLPPQTNHVPTSSSVHPLESRASPPPVASTVDSIMAVLNSGCIKKNTGWWTYEVCHGDEVRQYHPENNKIDSSQSWSLGLIDPAALRTLHTDADGSADVSTAAGSPYVSVEFVDGQMCDEIKAPRSGELRYVCGDAGTPTSADQPSAIQSVEEPGKCRYSIVVAVPALCAVLPNKTVVEKSAKLDGSQQSTRFDNKPSTPKQQEADADAIESSTEATLGAAISSIAEQLNGACFYHVDGWWTYELCINKHVRQFRQPEKSEGDNVEQEFYLGMFEGHRRDLESAQGSAPYPDQTQRAANRQGTERSHRLDSPDGPDLGVDDIGTDAETNAAPDHNIGQAAGKARYIAHLHKNDPERSYAYAEYGAGDACEVGPEWESDIVGLSQSRYRETEVRFQCAQNGQDSLVSVREVTTCAYLLVFASARLCQVPEFSLAKVVSSNQVSVLLLTALMRFLCAVTPRLSAICAESGS